MPRFEEKAGTYFITFALMLKANPLSAPERKEVFNIIRQGHSLRYDLYTLVVMPDHVHNILHAIAQESPVSLPTIMHHIKGFSAFKINKLRGRKGALWQARYHSRLLRNKKEFTKMMKYIIENPLRAKLVDNPEDYPYLWFKGKDGLL